MTAWTLDYYSAKVARTIEAWPDGIRASFLRIAETMLEYGPDLGLPHTRALGGGLFEVRAKGREGIGRALYCTVVGGRIVILHAFIKKTTQAPARELDTARRRLREVRQAS